MKTNNRSSFERVFSLVNQLSVSEKRAFLRYVSAGSQGQIKKSEAYFVIFDTIKSSRGNIDKTYKSVAKLVSEKKIPSACRYLEKLIFESVALVESGGVSNYYIYRAAKNRGFFQHAQNALESEIRLKFEDM